VDDSAGGTLSDEQHEAMVHKLSALIVQEAGYAENIKAVLRTLPSHDGNVIIRVFLSMQATRKKIRDSLGQP